MGRNSIAKTRFTCIALLVLSGSAYAQSDDELRHDIQLTVSKAFSECAAYFELVDAGEMKNEATFRAVAHAADVEKPLEAQQIVDANFAAGTTKLADLEEQDLEAFEDKMSSERMRCRMAVNDPSTFIEKLFRSKHSRKTQFQLPEGLTAESFLKNAKPTSGVKDHTQCSKPAIAHTFALDEMLVEGGMVCPRHEGGICESERAWMSYRQYIEKQYPDRVLAGYSEKASFTFKDGKTQSERILIGCFEVPQLDT